MVKSCLASGRQNACDWPVLMKTSSCNCCGAYRRGQRHLSPSRATAVERAGEVVHHRTGCPEVIGAASLALDVPSLVIQHGNYTNGSGTVQKEAQRKLFGGMK